MNERRLFGAEAILLFATLMPLALAENAYWLPALGIFGMVVGWWRTVRQNRPLIGPIGGAAVVLFCFAILMVEYFGLHSIPVVALAHFMGLVCISKFLGRRTYRDHGQLFVLLLLLLVVAAIVSGNLLFPAALAVFLTVGLSVLIYFHLNLEAARIQDRNRHIAPLSLTPTAPTGDARISVAKPVMAIAVFSALAGVAIFISVPRFGAGLLSQWHSDGGGSGLTGMSNSLKFSSIGPIRESEVPVMRVQIEGENLERGPGPYFRGWISTQYKLNENPIPTWQWQRFPNASSTILSFRPEPDGLTSLQPFISVPSDRVITQHYWLEPAESSALFTCYPPLELQFESTPPDELKKCVEDQLLHMERRASKLMRYTVRSARMATRSMADALRQERAAEHALEPQVSLDDLPRAAEIRALIDRLKADIGPLDSPGNRLALARRFEEYFHSSEFKYTLHPPPNRPGIEPIGEFLLKRRRGHCEYFAAAMTIMCQMSGVPARVVSGYCGGDYNEVGHFFIVRQKHAHAWVEVFVPGLDWVTFDPTPPRADDLAGRSSRMFLGLSKYFDYFQFQWANLVISYDADLRRSLFSRFSAWLLRPVQDEATVLGAVAAFVRELFGWRLQLNWRERFIYWVFTLLIVTLAFLVGYVLYRLFAWLFSRLRRLWPERAHSAGAVRAEFYRRFCRQLRAWGIARRPDQTPAEFARELTKLPFCAPAAALVQAYYQVAFGGVPLSPAQQAEIDSFLARLATADANQIRAELATFGNYGQSRAR